MLGGGAEGEGAGSERASPERPMKLTQAQQKAIAGEDWEAVGIICSKGRWIIGQSGNGRFLVARQFRA